MMKVVKEFLTGMYIVMLTIWYIVALIFGGTYLAIKGWRKGEK